MRKMKPIPKSPNGFSIQLHLESCTIQDHGLPDIRKPVANVEVQITGPGLCGTQCSRTDENGDAIFPFMPYSTGFAIVLGHIPVKKPKRRTK